MCAFLHGAYIMLSAVHECAVCMCIECSCMGCAWAYTCLFCMCVAYMCVTLSGSSLLLLVFTLDIPLSSACSERNGRYENMKLEILRRKETHLWKPVYRNGKITLLKLYNVKAKNHNMTNATELASVCALLPRYNL